MKKANIWLRLCAWYCSTFRNGLLYRFLLYYLDRHAWDSGVIAGYIACKKKMSRLAPEHMSTIEIYRPYGEIYFKSLDMYEQGVQRAVIMHRLGFGGLKRPVKNIAGYNREQHLEAAFYIAMDGEVLPDPRPLLDSKLKQTEDKLIALYAKYAEEYQQIRNAPL